MRDGRKNLAVFDRLWRRRRHQIAGAASASGLWLTGRVPRCGGADAWAPALAAPVFFFPSLRYGVVEVLDLGLARFSDKQVSLTIRPDGPPRGAVIDLKSVRLPPEK
ncbi:MAG TPA: hypothetical protein VND64_28440 [Pirellulales bacterium]|nr:hypothetical protein [Pirellulales bacterium]